MKLYTKVICLSLLTLLTFHCNAQVYTAKAKLAKVDKKNFYRIPLNAQIKSISQSDYKDLRLIDANGKEIPYLLQKNEPTITPQQFKDYEIISQSINDSLQSIIVHNSQKNKINNIVLQLANADAERIMNISGSENQKDWFVVKDDFYFYSLAEEQFPETFKMLSFPVSNYSYYKIIINNKKLKALNISKAGYFQNSQIIIPSLNHVSGITFTQKDSNDKKTYLRVICNPANFVDKLILNISTPQHFHRDGYIAEFTHTFVSSHKRIIETNDYPFTISSDKETAIDVKPFFNDNKCDTFLIVIKNDDNQALIIDSINAFQSSSSLIAELSPNNSYVLFWGDSTISSPTYDLVYFKDKIPTEINEVALGEIELINNDKSPEVSKQKDNSKYLVWAGLALATIFIAYMTNRMLQDMRKGN